MEKTQTYNINFWTESSDDNKTIDPRNLKRAIKTLIYKQKRERILEFDMDRDITMQSKYSLMWQAKEDYAGQYYHADSGKILYHIKIYRKTHGRGPKYLIDIIKYFKLDKEDVKELGKIEVKQLKSGVFGIDPHIVLQKLNGDGVEIANKNTLLVAQRDSCHNIFKDPSPAYNRHMELLQKMVAPAAPQTTTAIPENDDIPF